MKWFKNLKETGDLKHIYKNELDEAGFAYDVPYSDSKDLGKRTISGNILKERAYEIVIYPKCDGYQSGLVRMIYKFFDKKQLQEQVQMNS